jgi:Tfp pilus assembly protein PilV
MIVSSKNNRSKPTGGNPWAPPRRAFSLLEVIVAMAIFFISIVAIGQLITMAGEHALEIEQQGEAAMLAQAKINEVIAGVVALSAQSDQSFDEAPDYRWALTADQNSSISNLYTVTVVVSRERSDGSKVQVSLSQLVLDPAQRGSSQDTVTISSSGGGSGGSQSGASSAQSGSMQQPQTSPSSMQKTGPSGTGASPSAPKTSATTAPKTSATTTPKTTTPTTTAPKTTAPSTSTPKTTTSKAKGG